jgi:serine/threonine protein kinase/WD40 repeat protein
LERLVAEAADRFTSEILKGRTPEVESYAEHYPEAASLLREVLPALAVLVRDERAASDAASSHVERTLGDFRLIAEIGRGGMGVVYEAEQISLGRRIAVKVLPFAGMLDSQQLARFKYEARAAATLDHPNIVGIYSIGCDRGVHYYAMRLIDGVSLDQVICGLRTEPAVGGTPSQDAAESPTETHRRSLLSTQRNCDRAEFYRSIAQLGVQAAEALHYAHERGIVHRDVKPANLMLDSTGNLWVSDFGLARVEGQANLTLTGDLLGTLRYMSPEQALGDRPSIDRRTDVFSLGATLYELIAQAPATSGSARAAILRSLTAEPTPLRVHDRQVPADLETVLLKSLSREPGERYATARALADDLRRFLARQSIHARRPTTRRRVANWVRRNPQLSLALGAFGVLLSLVASFSAWSIDRARRDAEHQRTTLAQREQAHREAEAMIREQVYATQLHLAGGALEDNSLERVAGALDKLTSAGGAADLRGFECHYLSNLCRDAPRPFGKHNGEAFAASISPDEKLLATAGSDGVRLWTWPGRNQVKHLRDAQDDVDGVAWSPDGAWLASFSEDYCVRVYRASNWSLDRTLRLAGPLVGGCFAPDGAAIMIAERRQTTANGSIEGRNVVHVYDVDGWRAQGALEELTDTMHGLAVSADGRFLAAGAANEVCVWDLPSRQLKHRWPLKGVNSATFARQLPRLAVALSGELRIYDVSSGKLESALPTADRLEGVAFGRDDRTVISVGRRQVASIWKQAPNGMWHAAGNYLHTQPLWGVSCDKLGRLVTTDRAGGVWAWDVEKTQERSRVLATTEHVKRWLTLSDDARPVEGFAATAEKWSRTAAPKPGVAAAIAWSPTGSEVVVVNTRGDLTFWNTAIWAPIRQLNFGVASAGELAWSPNGRWVAVSGIHSLALIDRRDFRIEKRISIGAYGAPVLAFSKDGATVFAAWRRRSLDDPRAMAAYGVPTLAEAPSRVPIAWGSPWDASIAAGGDLARFLEAPSEGPLAAAAAHMLAGQGVSWATSMDGQTIAAAMPGGVVDVTGPHPWQRHAQFSAKLGAREWLALTPNGRTLATIDHEGRGSIWSAVTGHQFFRFNTFLQTSKIAFSPDGKQLVAIGQGPLGCEEICIWNGAPEPIPDELVSIVD